MSQATTTPTFLFTDVEGSTRLWEQSPEAMTRALERHDALLHAAVVGARGAIVKSTGDGVMAVFASALDAVEAAVAAQLELAAERWPEPVAVRVRMGIHAGETEVRADDYFGPTVNRTARIMAAGHGGQILLSSVAVGLLADRLPAEVGLRDLGEHRLKDLGRPEHLYQVLHSGLASEFPPLATLGRRPNNLPTQASALVGRDTEAAAIRGLLEDHAVRLVTLIGPGGTGKTRLALRAAAEQIDAFSDGVFFVDLAPMRDADAMLAATARAVGLTESGERPLLDDLTGQLREQRLLLLYDNFEQVTSAAPTAVQLLEECPDLKLLVTSREALRVRGERLFPVPPLSLPGALPGAATAEGLGRYEAIQLFVERARAVRPDFRLTDENASAVLDICKRLDGLPLAIELATARLNLFSPEALRDRLGRSLQLLRGGARDLPERQQTLRATIEWSYDLLEPGEQRLFELLSVFASARPDSVEAVASAVAAHVGTDVDTIDGVTSLLDKSLVRRADADADEPRLMMLETIREYAAERLEERPEMAEAARRAHAGHFADVAAGCWTDLLGPRREHGLARLTAELDNLRAAWRHWIGERDLDQLDKLVDSLWALYDARGWYHATIELTTELMAVLSASESTPERARQLITLQTSLARALLALRGYTGEVEAAFERALELAEAAGDADLPPMFPVLRALASFHIYRADFVKGLAIGERILRLADEQEDASMLVTGHFVVGSNRFFMGDFAGGLAELDRAIETADLEGPATRRFRLGNDPRVAALMTSGLALWLLGFPDRALERGERALALALRSEHPFTIAYAHFHVGLVHLWRREPAMAETRAASVLAIAEASDIPMWRAVGTFLLGAAETSLGRLEDGPARIDRGLALYQGIKSPPVFWPVLRFVHAVALARAGRWAEARSLVDEAIGIVEPTSRMMLLPEFLMLRASLLLADHGDAAEAEAWLERAVAAADTLGARMSMLRAATRLARVWRERGEGERATALLRPIYESFTDGLGTADLEDAREVLATLPV